MLCDVTDRAVQIFGGKGVTNDTPIVKFYSTGRLLRIADGPDEVHMYQLGRNLIKEAETDSIVTRYFDEV